VSEFIEMAEGEFGGFVVIEGDVGVSSAFAIR
jgi:hypothetical protein